MKSQKEYGYNMSAETSVYNTANAPIMKYSPSVFTNIIEAELRIYQDKRDYYAQIHDDINMRYYEAKSDACRELLRLIVEKF